MSGRVRCFYSLANRRVIDITYGDGIGAYSLELFETLKVKFPDLQDGYYDDAVVEIEATNVVAPIEISEDEFLERLCVLPPMHWKATAEKETFKLSEMYTDNITEICCRIGNRFFKLLDRVTLTHDEIVAKVLRTICPSDFASQFHYNIESKALLAKAEITEFMHDFYMHQDERKANRYIQELVNIDSKLESLPMPRAFSNPLYRYPVTELAA
jgi:hypothetical protein